MFRYKIGTVRLFADKDTLQDTYLSLEGGHDSVLTDDYLQFFVSKEDMPTFKSTMRELCDNGVYTGFVIYEGVSYGEPHEHRIFSYNFDTWADTHDTLIKYGFITEYYAYKNSTEYAQEKQARRIRKVENYLTRLKDKQVVNI